MNPRVKKYTGYATFFILTSLEMRFKFLKSEVPGILKFLFKIAVSIAIIFIVIHKIDEKILLKTLIGVNVYWIFAALCFFILSKVLSAYRLNCFLTSERIIISSLNNLKLYWLCMYYNLLLPGGISGDGYKIKVLMDTFQFTFKKVFSVILLDRINGVLALGFIAFLLFVLIPDINLHWLISPVIISIFIVILFNTGLLKRFGITQVWSKASWYSMFVQLSQMTASFTLLLALGIDQHWMGYLWLFMLSSLSTMIPITLGGAGARELTFLYGSNYFGLDVEAAVAIGFLFYLISTFVSLTGIYFSFHKNFIKGLKTE
jgi:glycosyltransferase 2 family protein